MKSKLNYVYDCEYDLIDITIEESFEFQKSIENFKDGLSCSEAVVKACYDVGLVDDSLINIATSFSGGMGVRCLCGAVAGSQLVIGTMFGKSEERDGMQARALAKQFNEKFAEKYKVNCCKVLSAGYDFHSPERKNHCSTMVGDCCDILENLLKENMVEV